MRLDEIEGDRFDVALRWLVHDRNNKGTLAAVDGPQNAGKSTLMLHIAEALATRHEATSTFEQPEAVLWRGFRDASWHRYPGDPDDIRVLVDDRLEATFYRAETGGSESEWDPPCEVVRFDGADDLLRKADLGAFNVVYAKEQRRVTNDDGELETRRTHFWRRVVDAMRTKPVEVNHALFMDDLMDLWPMVQRGDDHRNMEAVYEDLGQFRKNWNSLYGAVHDTSEAHWLLQKKLQGIAYMTGSRPSGDSPVPAGKVVHEARKKGDHATCVLEHMNNWTLFDYPDAPDRWDLTVKTTPKSAFDDRDVLTGTTTIRGVPVAVLRLITMDLTNPHAASRDPELPSENTIRRALDDYKVNHREDWQDHMRLGDSPVAHGPDEPSPETASVS